MRNLWVVAVGAAVAFLAQYFSALWSLYYLSALELSAPTPYLSVLSGLSVSAPFVLLTFVSYWWGRSIDLKAVYLSSSLGLFVGGMIGGEVGVFAGPVLIRGGTFTVLSSASVPGLLLFLVVEAVGAVGFGIGTFLPGFAGLAFGSLKSQSKASSL